MTMAPKIKPDDIIEVFLDHRVVEAIGKALLPAISLIIEEALTVKLGPLLHDVKLIKQENSRLTAAVENLKSANINLNAANREMSYKLEMLESYQKCDNLIINGLPEGSFAECGSPSTDGTDSDLMKVVSIAAVETIFIRFCDERLGVKLISQDISMAHRLHKGGKDSTRPLIEPHPF